MSTGTKIGSLMLSFLDTCREIRAQTESTNYTNALVTRVRLRSLGKPRGSRAPVTLMNSSSVILLLIHYAPCGAQSCKQVFTVKIPTYSRCLLATRTAPTLLPTMALPACENIDCKMSLYMYESFVTVCNCPAVENVINRQPVFSFDNVLHCGLHV